MNWICDYCSSVNEHGRKTCFVCNQPRSRESIAREKAERRSKALERCNKVFGSVLTKATYALYAVGLVATLGCVIISLISCWRSGTLPDLFDSATELLHQAVQNAAYSCGALIQKPLSNITEKSMVLASNASYIWEHRSTVVKDDVLSAALNAYTSVTENLKQTGSLVIPLAEKVSSGAGQVGYVASNMAQKAFDSASTLFADIGKLIEEVKSFFT